MTLERGIELPARQTPPEGTAPAPTSGPRRGREVPRAKFVKG